jgi:hypothetical protein
MFYRRFYDDKTNMSPGRLPPPAAVTGARLSCTQRANTATGDRLGLGWAYVSAAGPDSSGFTTPTRGITAEGILET